MTSAPPHLQFASGAGDHLFLAAYGRLYDLPRGTRLDPLAAETVALLDSLSLPGPGEESLVGIHVPTPQSLSLNVSASCNLACTYCYAGQGGFGGRQAGAMEWETARGAVDRLIESADRERPITIGFLGGEPFLNRPLIHRIVHHAAARGRCEGLDVRFSVTTNGTLLREEDHRLLRAHPFAVTVSLDGNRDAHDRNRPNRGGGSSWAAAMRGVHPLLEEPGFARIAARATVCRDDLDLAGLFDGLAEAGFKEIGLSPLRVSPSARTGLRDEDWPRYLAALIGLARRELNAAAAGRPLRITNLAVALKQIHRGAASPYPCGAGGGYFSVGADGSWYACHRAVGEEAYRLGDNGGLDAVARTAFLEARHVDAQTDCRTCWARYLCSGGCHHEVAARTASSCDFVRGWLQFCLTAYCELGRGKGEEGEALDA
jgi:uncharacterized protein